MASKEAAPPKRRGIRTQEERELEEGLARKSARWNSALDAGYRPEDYGYDKDGRKTDAYTGYKLDPNKAVKDAAPKQRREAALAAEQRAQAAAPPRVSMIDGRPAHEVLKEGRARLGEANRFGPTKQERATEALHNSRAAARAPATSPPPIDELVMGDVRGGYDKPAGKPATPAPAPAPTPTPAPTPAPTPTPGVGDTGGPEGSWGEFSLNAAKAGALLGLPGAIESRGNAALSKAAKISAKADRLAAPAWRASRLADASAKAASKAMGLAPGVAATLRDADAAVDGAKTMKGLRAASDIQKTATGAVERLAQHTAALTARANEAAAASNALSKKANPGIIKGNKATAAATKLANPNNIVAKGLGKVAAPIGKVGGVAAKGLSKVAVPLQVALMLKEGIDLADATKRAEKMADFEATATNPEGSMLGNSLRSAGKGALNPVTGIYHTGHQLNEWSKSSGEAERAAAGLKAADARFAARQAAMAKDGVTKESLRAMPRKERSAILRRYRAANPN